MNKPGVDSPGVDSPGVDSPNGLILTGGCSARMGQYSPRQLLQQHDIQLLTAPAIEELTNINDPAARTRLGF